MDNLVETEIGTIAPDWKVARLEEICEPPQYGYTASAADEGTVRFLRITDITDSGVDWLTVPFCECPAEIMKKYRLACGDIVFARIGATTGKSFLLTDPPLSVFASYLIRIRAKHHIDPRFLSQFFRSDAYWRQVNAQKNANLKKGVSGSLLKTLVVPVPPLPEQQKIAAVLGLVQRAIAQQERLIALTTELKKALLHKLFTEGLRGEPQKQTEIGLMPESWEVAELGKLVNLFGGYAFRSEDSVAMSNTQLVRMGNLYQNKLDLTRSPIFYLDDFAQQYARFVLKEGDLIMSLTGTSGKEDYGFTVEVKHVPKILLLNQRVARIDITSGKVVKDFLFYFLLSRKFLDQLYQTAKGMKQANLSTYAMKQLKVPVPRVGEQNNITDYFRAIDQRNDIHQRQVDILSDLFRTLLHQLMTAQIRVNDLNLSELECEIRHA